VIVSLRSGASRRFGPPATVSGASAGDVAVARGAAGEALAAWTQGTSPSTVLGSLYTP
jgi:hypothetical protein